jgi:1-acyl-sn-glycerol-3-phosphate acyltransferase
LCVILYILFKEKTCMQFNILYKLAVVLVRAYSNLMLNMDVHWHERPPDGPKLYVANHPSASDPFLIHLLSGQPMSVLISANAFAFPLFGAYIRKAGQIPVIPGQGEQTLEKARHFLEKGYSVGIFPEGTFSPQDGGYQEPRSGAARLAILSGVPVIPVGIYVPREKSVKISSKLSGRPTIGYWYLSGPYNVTVGRPICFEGDAADKMHIQSVSRNIMQRIHTLAQESEHRLRRFTLADVSA